MCLILRTFWNAALETQDEIFFDSLTDSKHCVGYLGAIENISIFNFLQSNGIPSMAELHEKITAMQSDYYALRGEIVSAEREIATIAKHLEIWGQYGANKHPKTDSKKVLLESAAKYLNELKASGGGITPKNG